MFLFLRDEMWLNYLGALSTMILATYVPVIQQSLSTHNDKANNGKCQFFFLNKSDEPMSAHSVLFLHFCECCHVSQSRVEKEITDAMVCNFTFVSSISLQTLKFGTIGAPVPSPVSSNHASILYVQSLTRKQQRNSYRLAILKLSLEWKETLTSLTLYSCSLENEWVVIAALFPMPASKNKLL